MTFNSPYLKSWEIPSREEGGEEVQGKRKGKEHIVSEITSCVERFTTLYLQYQYELNTFQHFGRLPTELQLQIEREIRLSIFRVILDVPDPDYRVGRAAWRQLGIIHINAPRGEMELRDRNITESVVDTLILKDTCLNISKAPHLGRSDWFGQFTAENVGEIIAAEAAEVFYSINRFRVASQNLNAFANERVRFGKIGNFLAKVEIFADVNENYPCFDFIRDLESLLHLPHLEEVSFLLSNFDPAILAAMTRVVAGLEAGRVSKVSLHKFETKSDGRSRYYDPDVYDMIYLTRDIKVSDDRVAKWKSPPVSLRYTLWQETDVSWMLDQYREPGSVRPTPLRSNWSWVPLRTSALNPLSEQRVSIRPPISYF